MDLWLEALQKAERATPQPAWKGAKGSERE
jgi:hypothetical protein